MQTVKLLIVDDDEDDFLLTKELLSEINQNYQLEWAPTFEKGLSLLGENSHDLCLMDYKLGAQDGIALLRQAHDAGFSGPIILLTGIHRAEVDIQALEAGAVDYLVKSGLSAEQLARSIRYALARNEVEKERVERLKAEAENRAKSEFLAHLSHELRTPLSAILGFTELLINKKTDLESLAHLHIVHRNGKHLLGLLNDVLDLSKIEAGKLELEKQTVHLSSFLCDIYFLMRGAAIDKNLRLRVEAPEPLPAVIYTDPMRLRQILLNLIGNAIKFTNDGEVVLHIQRLQEQNQEKIAFTVSDTGIGISANVLELIFEPFVQSTDTYAHPRAGTGLGLTISKMLVARLGGEIHVTSEVGKGSKFEFTIDPGDLAHAESELLRLDFDLANEKSTVVPRFNGRVLVVDDLRDIRLLIGHFVALTGLEVMYANNGEEVLQLIDAEMAQGRTFDLVLMDIHMPVMNGHEAAKKLRAKGFNPPLVALTAAHMKGDMDRCYESGFSSYLGKPVDQARLYECMANFLPSAPSGLQDEKKSNGQYILVVEDNLDALHAMAALLGLLGWQTITARDAATALVKVKEYSPAFLLLDINLPDMNGYVLAAQIRSTLPDARIILASGEELDKVRAGEAGVNDFILKPVSLEQLQDVLQ
ncbi:response regulator [Cellvibrio mixtus]|uniref:response regulator n=1 Tax=Cellvibrio mixtus TaxID=39650 RepID=UPI0005869DDC|nr:response regulator [Cellvibrio mixtus]